MSWWGSAMPPAWFGMAAGAAGDVTPAMARLVLQVAVIVLAARTVGLLFRRFLRAPAVLGELCVGMALGPYALGGVALPGIGPLFPPADTLVGVSRELYGLATTASIVLLFLSGLETDVATFLRYSTAGLIVGLGGVVVSFFAGAFTAVLFGVTRSWWDPAGLFLGTIATATSVGLTARILSEKRGTGSPEGVTIIAAAVLDDVFGIVLLGLVVAMARAGRAGASLAWGQVGWLAAKAVGFWTVFTAGGLLLAGHLSRLLKLLRSPETIAMVCLGLAFLVAGLSEMAGLAMIIGAYIAGLALSRTDLAYEIQKHIRGLYGFLVPIFFCVMGMMVDIRALRGVVGFGLIYSVLGIAAKLIGCGLPAWLVAFTPRGALRIGLGMVPRAEVCLVVAAAGLSTGAITPDLFGTAAMLVVISSVATPPLLARLLEGEPGVRGEARLRPPEMESVVLTFPSSDMAEFVLGRLARAFRREAFFVHHLPTDIPTYQVRKEEMAFTIIQEGPRIVLNAPATQQHVARLIVLEELVALQDFLAAAREMKSLHELGVELIRGMFRGSAAE